MIREQLLNPSPADLSAFLLRHTRAGQCLIQVAGEAEVSYRGRAASVAEAGQYLLIIKRDGSVQIHHPKGIKPLNWQPKTDRLHAQVEAGYCVFTASRTSPDETVRMVMLNVALAQALDIQEEPGFTLSGTEAQMQAALARQPELIEPGLRIMDRELFTGVGDIDLFARDAQGRLVIVELKRAKATHDAVHQLSRYVDAVRRQVPHGVHVRGVIAAPSITHHADLTLETLALEFKAVTALPTAPEQAAQPPLF